MNSDHSHEQHSLEHEQHSHDHSHEQHSHDHEQHGHDHSHEQHGHEHDQGGHQNTHGHTHEIMEHPGSYSARSMPLKRDYSTRAYTVGIGGPVGSGKTALLLSLCQKLGSTSKVPSAWDRLNLAVVTNDIFTREDAEFLIRNEALDSNRILAIETGGCPHAAIREDISMNLDALESLHAQFGTELLLIESGGDNLAANYSRELADFIIYVIDVAGGDKIPRGPGITESDLLVINKTDLAALVGADLDVMKRDALSIRHGGPLVLAQVKNNVGVDEIISHILAAYSVSSL